MDTVRKNLMFVITQPVVGGAQKYVFDLAKHFSGVYQVLVASGGPADGDLFRRLGEAGVRTCRLKFLGREVRILDDILAFFELLKLFRAEKPNIVHLNSSKVGVLGSLAAFFYKLTTSNYKLKTIFTAHGWFFKEDLSPLKKRLVVFLEKFSAWFKDKIICVSQDDFNLALKYKIAPPRKVYTIYNSLGEGAKFLPREKARAELSKMIGRDFQPDSFWVVNLGRLYATKGLGFLVETVNQLKTSWPGKNIILVIFGDGPERENIKYQISNIKIEEAVFLVGDVPDASRYLKAFDALVLSSVKEGFPYAVLEAGQAVVPVVATNVGGVGEAITDGETGFLVKPKDSQALSDAVAKIIMDEPKAKKMALKLKKTASEKFGFETMAQKTEWVYRN